MKKYRITFIITGLLVLFIAIISFIPFRMSKLIPVLEEQIAQNAGVEVHIERLIFRLGPTLKIKTPIMHVMNKDGRKIAQFNNVKFYISWFDLLQRKHNISKISANKLILKVDLNKDGILDFDTNINKIDFNVIPNIYLKEYSFTIFNSQNNNIYNTKGKDLDLVKVKGYKNFKIKTKGDFNINDKKYLTFDLQVNPSYNFDIQNFEICNLTKTFDYIKELDFYSDIITDLKLYKNSDNIIQASGFINLDNISVLDKQKKNPKSFIYLTLWGDKASILSNIYATANQKIYLEGVLNNSNKPNIDLKVKTDDIKIKDLYEKLSILSIFPSVKKLDFITGDLNANFSLKGDLNKIKSNGYLKLSNAGFGVNGITLNKINTDIDFSNNIISIKNATGFVNTAPITAKGYIDKTLSLQILMDNVELKYLCPSSWGVKTGMISSIINVNGTIDNIIHKENIKIKGLSLDNNKVNLKFDRFYIDTNKSEEAVAENIFLKVPNCNLLKIPTLKFQIYNDNINIPATNIFMENSKLTLLGKITDIFKNINFSLEIDGFVNSKDFDKTSSYSSKVPLKLKFSGNKLIQTSWLQLLFEKTDILNEPMLCNLLLKISKNNIKIEDLSLLSFSGDFSKDFKSNLKGAKKITISGLLERVKQEYIAKNIRIFIPQLLELNLLNNHLQLKGDLFINGQLNNPEIIGQLFVQNLLNQSLDLSLSNCSFDFNKNNIVINTPQLKLEDSLISINALASTDFTKGLLLKNLSIKSKFFNTDTFLMYKDSPLLDYPISIKEGKFYTERLLANIYGSSLYMNGFTADLALTNQNFLLKNISAEMYNGKLIGDIEFNLHDEHFLAKIMARAISAEPIFNVVTVRKDTINGIMDFDATLRGELTSKQTLSGDLKFIVNNGRMTTLGRLEHLLYAQNVIADNLLRTSLSVITKAITLKDTGLFKFLRGEIVLNNGIADIKMLQSQGPLMSLFIKGKYNTIDDYANLIVLGRLSDEIIAGLGAFGDFSFNKLLIMLTGEEKKDYILPEDFNNIPQLPVKNTKEFRSIINGVIDRPSSIKAFNWISYTEKSFKQKEVPLSNIEVPAFVETLPY